MEKVHRIWRRNTRSVSIQCPPRDHRRHACPLWGSAESGSRAIRAWNSRAWSFPTSQEPKLHLRGTDAPSDKPDHLVYLFDFSLPRLSNVTVFPVRFAVNLHTRCFPWTSLSHSTSRVRGHPALRQSGPHTDNQVPLPAHCYFSSPVGLFS